MERLPRMRTAEGVILAIREQDPNTAISLHYIRRMIKTETVPVVFAGKKRLVDVDSVLEKFIAGVQPLDKPTGYGQMRRIKE